MSVFKTGRVIPARATLLALVLTLGLAGPLEGGRGGEGGAVRQARVDPGLAVEEPETPATLAIGPGGRELQLSGDLTEGVATRVAALLDANPRVERLALTSDGGLVEEAQKIGRLVRSRRLATYVPDACASACTLIFVQGRKRYVGPLGRLGFHAPYEVDDRGRKLKVDPAPERAAYRAAGLPVSFVSRVLTVAPADLWIPTTDELRVAGIVTDVVRDEHFPETHHARPARVSERPAGVRLVAQAGMGAAMHGRAGRH